MCLCTFPVTPTPFFSPSSIFTLCPNTFLLPLSLLLYLLPFLSPFSSSIPTSFHNISLRLSFLSLPSLRSSPLYLYLHPLSMSLYLLLSVSFFLLVAFHSLFLSSSSVPPYRQPYRSLTIFLLTQSRYFSSSLFSLSLSLSSLSLSLSLHLTFFHSLPVLFLPIASHLSPLSLYLPLSALLFYFHPAPSFDFLSLPLSLSLSSLSLSSLSLFPFSLSSLSLFSLSLSLPFLSISSLSLSSLSLSLSLPFLSLSLPLSTFRNVVPKCLLFS